MTDSEPATPIRLTRGANDEWTAFVSDHSAGTVFHTQGWTRTVENVFGYAPHHLLFRGLDTGRTVGVFPCFEVPTVLGRTMTNPFCEYGFPLVDSDAAFAGVVERLTEIVGRFDAIVIKARPGGIHPDYHSAGFGGVPTGTSLRLRLDRPFDDVRSSVFDKDVRRCLRIGERAGVEVAPVDDVDTYYPLYLDTMRRLGSPPFPRRFFRELSAQLGDSLTLLVARVDGEPAGGVLVLEHGGTSYLWNGASRQDYWDDKVNHVLYAEAIRHAAEADQAEFDFGRSKAGSGVHKFKSGFGGRPHELTSLVYPPHRAGRASIDRFRLLAPLARLLSPVIAHRTVGPRLKRWIAE